MGSEELGDLVLKHFLATQVIIQSEDHAPLSLSCLRGTHTIISTLLKGMMPGAWGTLLTLHPNAHVHITPCLFHDMVP